MRLLLLRSLTSRHTNPPVLPRHASEAALHMTSLVDPAVPAPDDLFTWGFDALAITDRRQLINAIGERCPI